MELLQEKVRPRTNDFFWDLSTALNCPGNREEAFQVFKGLLHAVRDSVPVESAIQIQTHLPVFLKGFFAKGWKPFEAKIPFWEHPALLNNIYETEDPVAVTDPELQKSGRKKIESVVSVMELHIPADKMQMIRGAFPGELLGLILESAA